MRLYSILGILGDVSLFYAVLVDFRHLGILFKTYKILVYPQILGYVLIFLFSLKLHKLIKNYP